MKEFRQHNLFNMAKVHRFQFFYIFNRTEFFYHNVELLNIDYDEERQLERKQDSVSILSVKE